MAIICGFVYLAIDRQLNHKFLAVLVPALVLLVAALVTAIIRRARRRRGDLTDH